MSIVGPLLPINVNQFDFSRPMDTDPVKRGTKRAASGVFASSTTELSPLDLSSKRIKHMEAAKEHQLLAGDGSKTTRLPPPPWNETDLVIYPDNFFGPLPSNGISESEFAETNQLYLDICSRKKIFQIEGDENFKKNLLEQVIKKILCRSIGRKLLFKIAEANKVVQVFSWEKTHGEAIYDLLNPLEPAKIYINLEASGVILAKLPNGESMHTDQPIDCTLFHELCHVWHNIDGNPAHKEGRRPLSGDEYMSRKEELTIVGIGDNPYNENQYRAESGLLLRAGHLGCYTKKSDLEQVDQEMLKPDPDINHSTKYRYFIEVSTFGLIDEVKEFIARFPDFCQFKCSSDGETVLEKALDFSLKYDNWKSFEFLIKAGVRPLHINIDSSFPTNSVEFDKDLYFYLTYWAAAHGAPRIMRKLLSFPEMHQKINKPMENSILNILIYNNCSLERINPNIIDNIKLLLQLGADPLYANVCCTTALHWATYCGSFEVMKLLYEKICKLLDEKGSSVAQFINQATTDGNTSLYNALTSGNMEAVFWLLEKGADVNAKTIDGDLITHEIVRESPAKGIVNLLKIMNIDFKARGAKGKTLLHCLVENENLSDESVLAFVKCFLAMGVDGEAEDSDKMKFHDLCEYQELADKLLLLSPPQTAPEELLMSIPFSQDDVPDAAPFPEHEREGFYVEKNTLFFEFS